MSNTGGYFAKISNPKNHSRASLMIKYLSDKYDKSNLSAINLYQRLGFKVISLRRNYYEDGRTALIMHFEH